MLTISEQASVRVKTYDSATGEGTIKLDFSGMATLHCPPITFKKKAQVRYVILLALCRRATDQVMPRMSLPTPKAFLYMYKVVLSTGALAPALSLPSLSMMHRPSTSMLRRASSTTSPLPSPRSSIALTRTPSSCTSRCPRRRRLVPRSCRTFQSRSRPPRAATRRPICKPRSQRPEWLERCPPRWSTWSLSVDETVRRIWGLGFPARVPVSYMWHPVRHTAVQDTVQLVRRRVRHTGLDPDIELRDAHTLHTPHDSAAKMVDGSCRGRVQ